MNLQPCALLCVNRYENDSLASHRRLRLQACKSDSAAVPDVGQDQVAQSVHDDISTEARSQ